MWGCAQQIKADHSANSGINETHIENDTEGIDETKGLDEVNGGIQVNGEVYGDFNETYGPIEVI